MPSREGLRSPGRKVSMTGLQRISEPERERERDEKDRDLSSDEAKVL